MMPQPLSADLISGFQIYFPANQERNISYILTMCMHIYIQRVSKIITRHIYPYLASVSAIFYLRNYTGHNSLN